MPNSLVTRDTILRQNRNRRMVLRLHGIIPLLRHPPISLCNQIQLLGPALIEYPSSRSTADSKPLLRTTAIGRLALPHHRGNVVVHLNLLETRA